MVEQVIDADRATRLDDNLFFACSLIEHIGRETANRRQDVVNALGPSRIARIIEFADVFHCENPDAVVYRFIEEAGIEQGPYDNVGCAHYGAPTYRDMGKVYKRLATGIMHHRSISPADAVIKAFCSPVADLINDYSASFFYEAPANILTAHLYGVIE